MMKRNANIYSESKRERNKGVVSREKPPEIRPASFIRRNIEGKENEESS